MGASVMAFDHHHHHHHRHGQSGPATAAFAWATGLNAAFVVAEYVFGFLSQSVALVADATHNLGDVAGLLLAWGATALARRRPTRRRTYGFGKATILAALTNAILLLLAVGAVAWEAIERLWAPPSVDAPTVIAVAALGVVINTLGAALFVRGQSDVNVRAAFLHLAADAAVSVGVVITGIILYFTAWAWLDPAVSLAISVVVLLTAWSLLRDSFNLSMDAVPRGIDIGAVDAFLREADGVLDVHDLHVWAMSANENALTAHVVVAPDTDTAELLHDVGESMRREYGICHCTVQVEPPDARPCAKDHPGEAC